jgi:hypothetical protein
LLACFVLDAGHGKAIRVGVYVYGAATAWVDEVYVGPDTTRQFTTPAVVGTGVDMERPAQTNGWEASDIGVGGLVSSE